MLVTPDIVEVIIQSVPIDSSFCSLSKMGIEKTNPKNNYSGTFERFKLTSTAKFLPSYARKNHKSKTGMNYRKSDSLSDPGKN